MTTPTDPADPKPADPITPAAPAAPAAPSAEATELAALKAKLDATAQAALAEVPEHLKAIIPTTLPPAELIDWVGQARAAGLFKPNVPATPTPAPAITPKTPDTASLPIYARLAAGYSKSA